MRTHPLLPLFITQALIRDFYEKIIETILEIDSSNYIYHWGFSQLTHDGLLHPVVFFSKNFNLAECNNKIYNINF